MRKRITRAWRTSCRGLKRQRIPISDSLWASVLWQRRSTNSDQHVSTSTTRNIKRSSLGRLRLSFWAASADTQIVSESDPSNNKHRTKSSLTDAPAISTGSQSNSVLMSSWATTSAIRTSWARSISRPSSAKTPLSIHRSCSLLEFLMTSLKHRSQARTRARTSISESVLQTLPRSEVQTKSSKFKKTRRSFWFDQITLLVSQRGAKTSRVTSASCLKAVWLPISLTFKIRWPHPTTKLEIPRAIKPKKQKNENKSNFWS